MPYKHENLDFGSVKYEINKEELIENNENIKLALDLELNPVGIKFIYTEEEYLNLKEEEIKGKMAYCQMVKRATRNHIFKMKYENNVCDGATTALGLEKSNKRIEIGEEYYSYNLYETKAAARRMRSNIKSFSNYENQETFGILIGDLDKFDLYPDLVIIITNPYQAMRLVQGYEYHSGIKPDINMGAMQALCSELTVVPMMTGSMNVSMFCPSTRMLCKWDDSQMGVAIPFEKYYKTIEGVFGTMATTDSKDKKLDIIARFKEKGKNINLNPDIGY